MTFDENIITSCSAHLAAKFFATRDVTRNAIHAATDILYNDIHLVTGIVDVYTAHIYNAIDEATHEATQLPLPR